MIQENIETLHQLKNLIHQLNNLSTNYIFRGQSNATWPLEPSAFRQSELKRRHRDYPAKENETIEWKNNPKIIEIIKRWLPGIVRNGVIIKPYRKEISKLLERLLIVMQYNFDLTTYWSKRENICEKDKKLIRIWESNHWCQEDTLIRYFDHTFPQLIVRYDLKNGSLISKPCLEEELTGLDETFPQHYNLSTAALDWSSDPYVAFYFGLDKQFNYDTNNGFYLPAKPEINIPAGYFSLFAYRQLQEDGPVVIMEKEKLIDNPRAEAQKGTFTYFKKPCSFYLEQRRFPTINDYIPRFSAKPAYFELQKFIIKYSNEIISHIEILLKQKGINKTSLLLDC